MSVSGCGEDRVGEDPSFSDPGGGAHLQAQVHAAQRNRGHHHLAHQGALHADLWRSQVGRTQERRSLCVISAVFSYPESGFKQRTLRNDILDLPGTYLLGLLGVESSMGPLGPLRECRRRRIRSSSPALLHIDSHLGGYGLGTRR